MVGLTFKQYLKETQQVETERVYTQPMEILPKNTQRKKETQKAQIANFPDDVDMLKIQMQKPEPTKFDYESLLKPVVSAGYGKERAIQKAKTKVTNQHFGPSQFYVVGAELKGPSVTLAER